MLPCRTPRLISHKFWSTFQDSTYYKRAGSAEAVLNRFSKIFQPPLSTVLATKSFAWEDVLSTPKIIFVNLSTLPDGPIRQTCAQLCMASIQTALKRTEHIPENQRIPYYMTIDEFDEFLAADESIDKLFRLARKQKCNVTIAHQTGDKVPDSLLGVIMGNVSSMIILKVSQKDAGPLGRELQLHQWEHDIPLNQVRQEVERRTAEHERWTEEHNRTYDRPGRTPLALPYTTGAEKATHIEKEIQRIIDEAKGALNPAILQNLDRGYAIVRIPGEHYGLGCKIALFKPKGGDSAKYSRRLIQNSKQVYGVKKPPITAVDRYDENDEDFLA